MFDSSQSVVRALSEQVRKYPRLANNNWHDISHLHGFATDYVMQLVRCNHGANFNARSAQMELFSKLTPVLMSEYNRDKKAETAKRYGHFNDVEELEWMLDWLEEQVKMAKSYDEANPDATAPPLGIGTDGLIHFNKTKRKVNGQRDRKNQRTNESSTDSFATVALATRAKKKPDQTKDKGKGEVKCVFCEANHPTKNCKSHMEVDIRLDKAFKARLCLWCLNSGHRRRDCVTGKPCGKADCKESHHVLLHGHRPILKKKRPVDK